MKYRKHQAKLDNLVSDMEESNLPVRILNWVVPGGGKSLLPGIVRKRFPKFKIGWFVPRLTLQRQAIESMKQHFGLELRDAGNEIDPSRGSAGFVSTHQGLMMNPELWAQELERHSYILVIDELHHAKRRMDGTLESLARAIKGLPYRVRLDMTGTLETSDRAFIDGVDYAETPEGFLVQSESTSYHSIRYTRSDALTEGALVPIEFHHHDGPVSFVNRDGVYPERNLSEAKKKDEAASLFTALNTDIATQLFQRGVAHWQANGNKLIVVTASQFHAKKYYELLKGMGVATSLAIDDNEKAHEEVLAFRGKKGMTTRAMVTCQMAYEGLDVPEATHLICLTHIRSYPWIEQSLGRVWRKAPGKRRCYAFIPSDPRMNRVIQRIREETPGIIALPGEGGTPPPGGEKDRTIPLSGYVTNVWPELLDEGSEDMSGLKNTLVALLADQGLQGDFQEYIDRFVTEIVACAIEQIPQRFETVKEQEDNYKRALHKLCRCMDQWKGVEYSTHQALVKTYMGKGTPEMNLEELKRAKAYASSLYPR